MSAKQTRQAEELAALPHQVHCFPDKTTDGDPCYVAIVPELPGCVSGGETVDEARTSVQEAKIDFIYFMLEDGLDVPQPRLLGSHTRFEMPGPDYEDVPAGKPYARIIQSPA